MRLQVAVIVASTREGRRGPVIGEWVRLMAAAREDLEVDAVDLAEARLPERLSAAGTPEVGALYQRRSKADAFVIVVPEYNHSFPASLKTALDWTSGAWKAKPVAFVSYGGRSGGIRAVEQVRQILPELHAVSIRSGVSFHDVWQEFHGEGQARTAGLVILEELVWWAVALRTARGVMPFPGR